MKAIELIEILKRVDPFTEVAPLNTTCAYVAHIDSKVIMDDEDAQSLIDNVGKPACLLWSADWFDGASFFAD